MKRLLTAALAFAIVGCQQDVTEQATTAAEPETAAAPAAMAGSMYNAMNPPVVEVAGGQLRGYMDDGTYSFIGIRYATAERFAAPQKVAPWQGVKDAQTYGEICPVPQQTTVSADEFAWPHRYWSENENCQFLNLWTQQLDSGAHRPVMVFLHGGGFTNGSSIEGVAYEGKNLSEFGDVVVVTLNHRLNVLGALNLSAYGPQFAKSGNMGMMDIEMALRWVHDNVEAFGGDPDNVTIFGQSGGSGKVVHLMHMPSAEGLFQRGIAESSGTASYLTPEESARIADLTLEKLGIDKSNVDEIKTTPYYTLLAAGEAALDEVREEVGRDIDWRPVVDGEYIEADYSDWTADMPFMVGSNFSEHVGTLEFGDGRKNEWTDEETRAKLQERFGGRVDEIIPEFQALFPDKKPADINFFAANYRERVWDTLDLRLNQSNGPVYNYLFAFEAPVNGGITAFHCAELIYVFHNVDLPEVTIATGGGPNAHKVQDTVARAWVNFATNGNPSQDGLEWQPFTSEGRGTMVLDTNSRFSAFDDRKLVSLMSEEID